MKKRMYCLTLICLILLVSAVIGEATVITSIPYTITERGYYTINKNMYSNGTGITVNANNVTIDLKGYTIAGTKTNTSHGIYMNGRNNVEIRNGTIRDFGQHGIYEESSSGHSHRVINVRVMNNQKGGVYMYGSNHIVRDCNGSNNGTIGIGVGGPGATISGNTLYGNGTTGISAGYGCTVSGNTAYENGNYGINTSYGSTVTGNTAHTNGDTGIFTSIGCTIIGNTANNNGGDGIDTGTGSTVKNNTAYYNQRYGIELSSPSLVDGNTAYQNNLAGGYADISSCGSCVFGINVQ